VFLVDFDAEMVVPRMTDGAAVCMAGALIKLLSWAGHGHCDISVIVDRLDSADCACAMKVSPNDTSRYLISSRN